MSVHFIARFQPRPGTEGAFREALLRVGAASRAEAGCLAFHAFESLREPCEFGIHSEWLDEEAFELHAQMPHTLHFLEAAEALLPHPVQGLRAREIGTDMGAGTPG